MTETQIIRGCQRGKAKYQKALVLRYSPQLMTVARRYCRDDHAAKDVLQETFIRIFRAIEQYEDRGTFGAWLRRIVINVALQKRKRVRFDREQLGLDTIPHPTVTAQALDHLNAEALLQLIQQLPEGFREIFNLYAIEGYSHDEIGELLGISAATSRSQLTRARKKLRAMILKQEQASYVKRVG